jgi:thiamine-phosphate pyrophosphorylase
MSPGVERAVAGARQWAGQLGSETLRLAHFLLALFDEEEGRPAVLVESLGQSPAAIRIRLRELLESPPSPADTVLFGAAEKWSLAHRHDPEFLTDAFLLAVLRADAAFERTCAGIGLDAGRIEAALIGRHPPESETAPTSVAFELPAQSGAGDASRILDANLNRAREAARVVEDYCRFALNDRLLTGEIKAIRHALGGVSNRFPTLLASRDTPGDVGTEVSAGNEYIRFSTREVAGVNLKRLQESLRSLEEYGKLLGPDLGRELESLRYRAYTVEGAIIGRGRGRERLERARLYVIVTGSQCATSLEATVRGAAEGGAEVIQLREKGVPDRELLARARSAVLQGADYLGVGPVFPSRTKEFDRFPGLDFVRDTARETTLPLFALGGITLENVGQIVSAGASRVAVASTVAGSADPRRAAQELRSVLERSGQPAEQSGN